MHAIKKNISENKKPKNKRNQRKNKEMKKFCATKMSNKMHFDFYIRFRNQVI